MVKKSRVMIKTTTSGVEEIEAIIIVKKAMSENTIREHFRNAGLPSVQVIPMDRTDFTAENRFLRAPQQDSRWKIVENLTPALEEDTNEEDSEDDKAEWEQESNKRMQQAKAQFDAEKEAEIEERIRQAKAQFDAEKEAEIVERIRQANAEISRLEDLYKKAQVAGERAREREQKSSRELHAEKGFHAATKRALEDAIETKTAAENDMHYMNGAAQVMDEVFAAYRPGGSDSQASKRKK